ncbi:MAG: lipid A deacylase LpxR family protein, partial [Nitrosopumilus sp.]|nr:lipid A deacylase LpxR family protein [Nitrosopumilus sp.]
LFFYLFILFTFSVSAQVIDNSATFRDTGSDKYIRFFYDNDFFTATDEYYTQGMVLEWVDPQLKKFPLAKLLIQPAGYYNRFGLTAEHVAYTPTSIRHPEIIYEDRPFAAFLLLKAFAISVSGESKNRIVSAISLGVIGPAAGGEEIQTSIHRWLNNIEPLGWSNQIANDFIINYKLDYEKILLNKNQHLHLTLNSGINIGSLSDKLSVGFSVMTGLLPNINNQIEKGKRNFKFHLYNQSTINLVGYDATLQGGLTNNNSPYILERDEVSRLTFQNKAGVVITIHKLHLEYFLAIITKEFNNGKYHGWGGIRIGWVY